MMNKGKQADSEDYRKLINSIDMLAMKMEAIIRELFEANVDFICKLAECELKEELNGSLSSYGARF